MAINITTTFTDLGKLLAAFANLNGFSGVGAPSVASKWAANGPVIKCQDEMVTDILTRLEGSGLTTLIPYGNWQDTMQSGINVALQSQKSVLQQLVTQVILKRVNNDVAQQDPTSIQQAMTELIRQMQSQSKNVAAATVSATTSAGAGNTGNATVYASLVDQNGLTLEYSLAETMVLKCIQDRFSGGTAGSETVSLTSPAANTDPLSYTWPDGSGLATTLTVLDPEQGNGGGGNLLTGSASLTTVGAFKAFSGSAPVAWTVSVDPTNVSDGTTNAYAGENHCLAFTGNTAGTNLNTEIYQNFANGDVTGGSTQTILPNTVYQFYCKIKADVVPAAGAIQFSLTDGSGTVINNNAGSANTITSTVSGFGSTAYQTVTGTFQTPTVMPENVRLRIKASTKITTGSIVYMDYALLAQPDTQGNGYGGVYEGGPYISIFRGSVDLINFVSPTIGDYWTIAVSNNYASSSPTPLSFNIMFQQLLNMATMGLILPTSGAGTEANTLIA